MAGAGILAGAGQALVIDKENLAVCLADYGDTGVIAGHKRQMLSENAFWGQIFQNASGSVVFVTDDGGLPVQKDAHNFPGGIKRIDLFSGVEASFLRFHAVQHPLAVVYADALEKESF